MTDVFMKVVNLSISASWLVLAVLAARLLPFRGEGELTSRETMRLMQEIGFREVSCRAAGLAGAVIGWKRKEMQA